MTFLPLLEWPSGIEGRLEIVEIMNGGLALCGTPLRFSFSARRGEPATDTLRIEVCSAADSARLSGLARKNHQNPRSDQLIAG
jgi:hypothetical protein